jgi:organic radical activating enzyme
MVKFTIPYVEIITTQICTLSCPGCSTYSDISHKGYVSWDAARKDIVPWLDRVTFDHFGIMGGEPIINPGIKDWIIGIRELMPDTTIRFPTNGTLIHKHLDVVDLLQEIGNVIFKITVHINDKRIEDAVNLVTNRYTWEKEIFEYNSNRLVTSNNFKLQINRPKVFFKTFQNAYSNAAPYNSDPIAAFDQCHQKECPLLINGRIYKCSTSGLMGDVLKRFENPNQKQWEPYLDNNKNGSISIESTNEQIQLFIDNIKKPHPTCRQCPTNNTVTIIDHLNTVTFK